MAKKKEIDRLAHIKPLKKERRWSKPVKAFAIKLISEFVNPQEVAKAVNERYKTNLTGHIMTTTTVAYFKTVYKDIIAQEQGKYLAAVHDVPIANKRVRLERAEDAYNSCNDIEDPSASINTSLRCLAHARTEMEGSNISIGNTFNTQINQYSDMSDKEVKDHVKKLKAEVVTLVKNKEGAYAV